MKSVFAVLGLCFFSLLSAGCATNIGRTNAKIDPGWNFSANGGAFLGLDTPPPADYDETEIQANSQGILAAPMVGIAIGYSFERVSLSLLLPIIQMSHLGLDIYALAYSRNKHHFGFGAEVGVAPAIYTAYTYDLSDRFFLTFTPKAHYATMVVTEEKDLAYANGKSSSSRIWLVGQIAFGFTRENASSHHFALFASYKRALGGGYSFVNYIPYRDSGPEYYRENFVQFGAEVVF